MLNFAEIGLSMLNPFLLESVVVIVSFLSALALMFVLEGIMPFSSPERWKRLLCKIVEKEDVVLRIAGFISMLVGVTLLTVVHQFAE
ncbi:hypothetical protein Lrub_0859 [Legionella rubrilucens]|uniref:DUF2065 domain-containing protein n=2 Tax=Legionella rubrilucens TaxID=458 RepID=A0A0W0XV49_9GAMM|nr:hypothetical protein Lrub_0859 [Legionella rubrilucens]